MVLTAYISFCYRNYMRQHRYLRDLVAIVVFSIFFGGFLGAPTREAHIWLVFCVFALLLNLLTAPSVFFLEQGNTLAFLLGKPGGRMHLFRAKVALTVLIDLFWVTLFAAVYGFRFLDPDYFLGMPLRLLIVTVILLLSTLLLSLAYTGRPQLGWLIFLLLVAGNIINKAPLLEMESALDIFGALVLFLPPFLELDFLTVDFGLTGWQWVLVGLAPLQIAGLYALSAWRMARRDFV